CRVVHISISVHARLDLGGAAKARLNGPGIGEEKAGACSHLPSCCCLRSSRSHQRRRRHPIPRTAATAFIPSPTAAAARHPHRSDLAVQLERCPLPIPRSRRGLPNGAPPPRLPTSANSSPRRLKSGTRW